MTKRWAEIRDDWLVKTSLNKKISQWALGPIHKNQAAIETLGEVFNSEKNIENENAKEVNEQFKNLKRAIKSDFTSRENEIDDLSLNTPNSFKLQISVPSNLSYLMKAWAAAEGRDLSSVALQCMEAGLREMKSKGSIPQAAIERYDISCEKRIALAEANNLWEKHSQISIEDITKSI